MGLSIHWTDFAKNELNSIFEYHAQQTSVSIARNIVRQIVERTADLKNFPETGAYENLLINRPQSFRYIVSTNYKIIYWVNVEKNSVEIVDVFDTRQNPEKIVRNK